MIRKILVLAVLLLGLVGCSDADTVSHNISREADQFRVMRRVVFYNGITEQYILSIEGLCSLGNNDGPGEVTVTCRTGVDEVGDPTYVKHFLGLSDNVTFFAEQLEAKNVSADHYIVIFKPQTIIPDVNLE